MGTPAFDELHFFADRRKTFRRAEAGWGRDGRRIAEDAGDYHSRAAWRDDETLGKFRPRGQRRPDGGREAAWAVDGRLTADGWSDGPGRNRRWTDAGIAEVQPDRFPDVLQKGGWSSEEVSEALGLNSRREKAKKPLIKPLPELAELVDW
ncbi:hAT transposon superfamily protein [Striga asiatica]|uniref:HAT transposon superfamily protein n=1 Tax=Striga asiatica TaxID=4170 RepID=A0A5A7QAE2_STRAF|nr:hAT transposon superfamily protein [Striga asiatica]